MASTKGKDLRRGLPVVYSMIHDRAENGWNGPPISQAIYPEWENHWLDCCRSLQSEFEANGLTETAKEFGRIHDEQSKFVRSNYND